MIGSSSFWSLIKIIFFSEISVKDLTTSSSKSPIFILLKKLSSLNWSWERFFKISEHLFVCDNNKLISFEYSGFWPISFSNSLATTVIVDKGVPKEWAAAAACNPIDSNSCSFAKINSNLFRASVLFLDSTPNLIPKYVKKTRIH